jgi:hypothetical protein
LNLNPYGNITQVVHPKVLYFENGFNGYKFWMAVTPYPMARVKLENPCILCSQDGEKWFGISANPLSLPDSQSDTYNSDTHLLYNSTTGKLECWYRYVGRSGDSRYEQLKRRVSSNGFDWDSEEILYTNNTGNIAYFLSPAVIWENDHYDMWVVSNEGGSYHIEYFTTPDGVNLTKIRDINLTFTYNSLSYSAWHIDVIKDNGIYIMLVMCKRGDDWMLFLATSDDNVTYSNPEPIIVGSAAWDNQIYRSSIVKVGSEYYIYYSAFFGGIVNTS